MRNFVFISPNFPKTYYQFPQAWKRVGGTSLCIGSDPYESLSRQMKESMDEYYQVNDLSNYDEMYRAVAWFAHKHGKIDWLESNNEFWLEQDAALREDFNICTGDKIESVKRFKKKSAMKAFYEKAGVPTARYHLVTTFEKGYAFAKEVGYPLIVKPDNGVGANATWKIHNEEELKSFYANPHPSPYIMEEYVPGYIVSFDGICDLDNNIIFKTSHTFPEPIMDIVNEGDESTYWSERVIPADLDAIGTKVIQAFQIRGRFFHTEYFRLSEDKPGLGKKDDLVALEVNMRPPGGYTTDMMNYANDFNIYSIYANMAMQNEITYETDRPYYCVYVGKRDKYIYKNADHDIYTRYGSAIVMHERIPEILAGALGEDMWMARFKKREDMQKFIKFILEKPGKRGKTK